MAKKQKIFSLIFDGLTDRQRDILINRYGLGREKNTKTLSSLGSKYGVTRERIRQIENFAISLVKEKINNIPDAKNLLDKIKKCIKDNYGVCASGKVASYAKTINKDIDLNHLHFLIKASGDIGFYKEDNEYKPFYYIDKFKLKEAFNFINKWISFLKKKKDKILSGKYDEYLKQFSENKKISIEEAKNYLDISKKIGANRYNNHRGLLEWPEIAPSTVRDRIYLVLKKERQPMHFRTIADFINSDKFGMRKVSAPSVHNELIKDSRFVLVGRGIYSLSEFGYEPGTAKEIIKKILAENGPMKTREIVLAVQKNRFFKTNTILANLQNKSFFERLSDGTYKIREA